MPLQVGPFPEHPPQVLRSDVGRLGNWVMSNGRRGVPLWSYLEYFDALVNQPIANIEFWTNVWRRATLGKKLVHGLLDALPVEFVERHN